MMDYRRSWEKIKEKILTHINCDDYKLFYVSTIEETKVLKMLGEIADQKDVFLYTYDIASGLKCDKDKRIKNLSDDFKKDLSSVIEWVEGQKKGYLVFVNINQHIEQNYFLIRKIKNFVNSIIENNYYIKIFMVSQFVRIPDELQHEACFIDFPLPTRDEIKDIVDNFFKIIQNEPTKEFREQIIDSLLGLREIDIVNALKFALYSGALDKGDVHTIIDIKSQIIKKESLLEFIKITENIENVGGMKNLKDWVLQKKKVIFNLSDAYNYGLENPKGILLFGMPGCGKSLVAKVISNEWKLPLLRLDIGMILGPYVGQSEENIRRAIKIAESIAPVVLWIDELEKAFAGISDGNSGGSDVMKRVFGSFLTWMQEKTKPVFVVATANDISAIPPEFLRKGRFDEIFYVDLPNKDGINEILKIHLRKRNKESWHEFFQEFMPKLSGFSGADIEALVKEIIELSFVNNMTNKKDDISKFIEKTIGDFKPITATMNSKIENLRNKMKEINAKSVD